MTPIDRAILRDFEDRAMSTLTPQRRTTHAAREVAATPPRAATSH